MPSSPAEPPSSRPIRRTGFASSNTTNQGSKQITLAPSIQITVSGGDSSAAANIKEQLRALFQELYQEAQEQDYTDRIMQHGYA